MNKTEIQSTPMPTVAMDIELAQRIPKGQTLEFDYDKFAQTAEAMGLAPGQVEALRVDISDPKYMKGKNGLQFHEADNIWVKYVKSDLKMTKVAVHETQHYADELEGMRLKNEKRYALVTSNKIGNLATAGFFGGTAAAITGLVTKNPALFYTGTTAAGAGWSAVAHYGFEPLEVRARAAEKQYADPSKPILSHKVS